MKPISTLFVNVGDLLHKQGSKDLVVIPDLFLGDNISGVSGSVALTGISDDELYVIIKDLSYTLNIPCDYCGKDKSFAKTLPDETYTFMLENRITPELQEEEVIFPIGTDMTIDLHSVIRDTILLADDVQHVCEDCKRRLETTEPEDEDEPDHNKIGGNIVFR